MEGTLLQNNDETSVKKANSKIKNQRLLKKKTAKSTLLNAVEKCSKCGKDIHIRIMNCHLERHREEEQRILEMKEARELASRTCQTCNERYS